MVRGGGEGVPCPMSILGDADVACLYALFSPCHMSNLSLERSMLFNSMLHVIKAHVALSN